MHYIIKHTIKGKIFESQGNYFFKKTKRLFDYELYRVSSIAMIVLYSNSKIDIS
jgi:hypothetical protein